MPIRFDLPLLPDDRPALVIGLISGTSVDGVDAAVCRLEGAPEPGVGLEVLGTAFHPYPEALAEKLRLPERLAVAEVAGFDYALGERFAAAALEAARVAGISPADVCLIGSHGQTIWHDPSGEATGVPASLQIGEPAVIAERTGIPVWSDFRPADLAAGGQGAPFVPYADRLLFGSPTQWTVCLNLGGIANVTLLPPGAGPDDVKAFDTGPANMVLDALAERLLGQPYDSAGGRGAAGRPSPARLRAALDDPYFAQAAPKSTGRERFGVGWVERHFGPLRGLRSEEVEERLSTAVQVTVESVARAIEGACGTEPVPGEAEVIVAGGGRRNRALMEGLALRLAPRKVVPIDVHGVDGDFKEAIAFAILAWASALGQPVNLPSATGARHPARCGRLSFPPTPDARRTSPGPETG